MLRLHAPLRFALAMGLSCCLCYAQADKDYDAELKALTATIQNLQSELTKTKDSRSQLQQLLQTSEEEIGGLMQKIDQIKGALDRQKKQLAQHQRQRAELEASRKQQKHQVNRIVQQAYLLGNQSHIKLLLNQEEPSRVSRLLRYHDYIVTAHQEQLTAYVATIQRIADLEKQIEMVTASLEHQQTSLSQRYGQLKTTQAQRLVTLKQLNHDVAAKGGAIKRLHSDRLRLEALLEEATQALSKLRLPVDTIPFRQAKGKLPYPTKGNVLYRYGSPRLQGKLHWKGSFIRGELGSRVVSIHHGRVIFSNYLRGHGLLLILDHGDGYMSLYAHNQTLQKETGDWVRSGETIATLGNTGGQTQAGLYFEIRYNGKPQNPKYWLSKRRS